MGGRPRPDDVAIEDTREAGERRRAVRAEQVAAPDRRAPRMFRHGVGVVRVTVVDDGVLLDDHSGGGHIGPQAEPAPTVADDHVPGDPAAERLVEAVNVNPVGRSIADDVLLDEHLAAADVDGGVDAAPIPTGEAGRAAALEGVATVIRWTRSHVTSRRGLNWIAPCITPWSADHPRPMSRNVLSS